MRPTLALTATLLLLCSSCTYISDRDRYKDKEVGISSALTLATVVSVHEVKITPQNTNTGMLLGGGAGAAAGSASGNGWATVGGAVAGAFAGSLIELETQDRTGMEYLVRTDEGDLKSVVQEKEDGVTLFKKGDRVMLQACDPDPHAKCYAGKAYQRLIPVPPELADIQAPAKPKHKRHHRKKPLVAPAADNGSGDGAPSAAQQ